VRGELNLLGYDENKHSLKKSKYEGLNTDLGIFGIGGIAVVKVKTSIYVDKELWEKYKLSLARNRLEVSQALEELIREELVEDLLDEALKGMGEVKTSEIDFELVKPRDGLVSIFVRSMRDGRADSLS